MRIAHFLCLFLLCPAILANTFYVSPNGNDSNPGTINATWKTWEKAFSSVLINPGDTVYFRGGVYPQTIKDGNGITVRKGGIVGKYVHYFAYPGEVPILDCSNVVPVSNIHYGIRSGTSYVHFKGLILRNVWEVRSDVFMQVVGWSADHDQIFENCTVYNIGGKGFDAGFYNNDGKIYYINCDAYNCYNPLSQQYPGGRGVGYHHTNAIDDLGTIIYKGCRAWKCSDQGWSMDDATVIIDGCWSFNNGFNGLYASGDGHGFKLGWVDLESSKVRRVIRNCISAYNYAAGFNTNDNGYAHACSFQLYNNISYHNDRGFQIFRTADTKENELRRTYKNNIAYNNKYADIFLVNSPYYTHEHNSWDLSGLSINDLDFISIDSSGLSGPRNADGSLPVLNFLKLVSTSDFIDAGIDVGLPFDGIAPDIGYSEFTSGTAKAPDPILVSSVIENSTPSRLEMSYNLNLANIVPSASAFTVKVNSLVRSVSSVDISGTKVQLTLSSPVLYGDVVTVAYTKPATNPLQTASGGQAATVTAQNVTNNVAAVNPVYVSSVIENATPARLDMTYNSTLANIVPAASAFSVRVNSSARSVSSVAISGAKVLLSLSSPVVYDDVVTVAYTKPATNPIQTPAGGQAVSITAATVTNNCRLPVNQPPVANISSPGKSGSFKAPATIVIDANVYDPDGTIIKVEFFNGTVKLGEVNAFPYSFTWKDVPEGTYSLTVIATDNKNAKTVSSAVSITVEKLSTTVNQIPVVQISSPGNGDKIKEGGKIKIEAKASDPDGTISKVEFKCENVTIAEVTDTPYVYIWDNVKVGSYLITACATDDLGASTNSQAVELIIEPFMGEEIINIYPNPNNGSFTVDINAPVISGNTNISIVSPTGRIVHDGVIKAGEKTGVFNIQWLKSGVYFLLIDNGISIVSAKKFIKN